MEENTVREIPVLSSEDSKKPRHRGMRTCWSLINRRHLVPKQDFLARSAGLFDRQDHFQGGHSPSAVGEQRAAAHDGIVECIDTPVASVLAFDTELDLIYFVVAIDRETARGSCARLLYRSLRSTGHP